MNFRHASGFLVFGLLLNRLPQLAPQLFSSTSVLEGGDASWLWTQLMSWVLLALGGGYALRRVGAAVASLLAYTPPVEPELVAPAVPLRPFRPVEAAGRQPAIARLRPRVTPPAEPAVETGLLEQRAA